MSSPLPPTPPEIISNQQAPAERNIMRERVLLTVALLMIAAMILYFSFAKDTVIQINCKGIEGGQTCAIMQSEEKPKEMYVCWELHRICSSGQLSVAKKCHRGRIEPNIPTVSLIAEAEFSNQENCEKVTAASIENVTVLPSWAAPTSNSK